MITAEAPTPMLTDPNDRNAANLAGMFHLPNPWSLEDFVTCVAYVRGRHIALLPTDTAGSMCGLWVSTDQADYIAYERNTSGPHREQIILHELGHMLFDHPSTALTTRRHGPRYSDVQEREAELFATTILQRVGHPPPPAPPAALARVAESLTFRGPHHGAAVPPRAARLRYSGRVHRPRPL